MGNDQDHERRSSASNLNSVENRTSLPNGESLTVPTMTKGG